MAGADGARCSVDFGGIAARAIGGITRSDVVAFIGGGTNDVIAGLAITGHACIRLRAWIAVVACSAVSFGGIRAQASHRIACAYVVARIGSGAHDWIGARAYAGIAGILFRARVAVIACGPISLDGIRTRAADGVAKARGMALIGSRANGWH